MSQALISAVTVSLLFLFYCIVISSVCWLVCCGMVLISGSANILLFYCAVRGAISLSGCTLCGIWTELAPISLTCTYEEDLEEKPTSWFSQGTALNVEWHGNMSA